MPGSNMSLARLAIAAAGFVLIGLVGCGTPAGGKPETATSVNYDRAFDAALGAMTGQKLAISMQDRKEGLIVGGRGDDAITATVRPQSDGTARVTFDASGPYGGDSQLLQRVVADYHRRMGR
jgi:hypothetical protein